MSKSKTSDRTSIDNIKRYRCWRDSNCSARDMAAKQEELADHHKLVGKLLCFTILPINYALTEENFRQSMKLHRRLVACA